MLHVGPVAPVHHHDGLAIHRVGPELAEGGGLARPRLLLDEQLDRTVEADREHVVARLERRVHLLVHHVRAKPSQARLHLLPRLGVQAQGPRQRQQRQRRLEGDVLGTPLRRQGRPLGLRVLVGRLAQLHIGAEAPHPHEHRQASGRIEAQRLLAPDGALAQRVDEGLIDVGRRHVRRQRQRLRLLALRLRRDLDEGSEAPQAHRIRAQPLGLDRAHLAGVDLLARGHAAEQLALVEVGQVGLAIVPAVGDLVEPVLHRRRELHVNDLAQGLLEQVGHGHRGEGGHQLALRGLHVAAALDRLDDRGIGAGATDALRLERLDQRGLAVARRRSGLVARGLDVLQIHHVALVEARQRVALVVELLRGIVGALDVGPEETGEQHLATARAQHARDAVLGILDLQPDGGHRHHRAGHLGRDGPLPDELVEPPLFAAEVQLGHRGHRGAGRADGLVGLLRTLGLRRVLPRLGRQQFGAVAPLDHAAHGRDGLARQVDRVGTHVGDVAVLIEALRDLHGARGALAELAVGLLLQRRGREGRVRVAHLLLALDAHHGQGTPLEPIAQGARRCLVEAQHDAPLDQAARVGVEVATRRDGYARHADERGVEGHALLLGGGLKIPPAARHEGHALALAHHEQAHGDALDAPGGQARCHLLPEQRRDDVAHQAIEDAPRLLRRDQLLIEVARVLQRALNRLFGDLVEHHAIGRHLRLQELLKVPADRLALAILIRREVDDRRALEGLLELGDHLLLVVRHDIDRREAVVDVHRQPSPVLALDGRRQLGGGRRQVAHVPHRGFHLETVAEELADCPRLRGGLHDDEGVTLTRCRFRHRDLHPRRRGGAG